jgi:hypothetical protein
VGVLAFLAPASGIGLARSEDLVKVVEGVLHDKPQSEK